MSKIWIRIIFFLGIILILSGSLRYNSPGLDAIVFLLPGYICLSLSYLIQTIKDGIKKEKNSLNITLQILCILMSVVLLFKYYPMPLLDSFSFFVVPLFFITAAIYLIKGRKRYIELTLTVIIYFFLSLPLFGIVFRKKEKLYTPRQYIPVEWYKQSDLLVSHTVELSYVFETKKAKKLFQEAKKLAEAAKYKDAIKIYSEMVIMEPENTDIYFELAYCYGHTGKFNAAITILDEAIAINDSLPYLFHNRGSMYYKLKQGTKAIADFQKTITLDSCFYSSYINIALVHCYQEQYQEAWEAIQKAEKFGGGEALDNMSPDVRTIVKRRI